MAKIYTSAEFILAMPAVVLRKGLGLGRTVVSQSLEVLMPPEPRELVTRLKQEKPLSDAAVAVDAIEKGRKLDLPELEYIGEAVLTKTLIRAETNPATPSRVTAQVVDIVQEVGLDPEQVPLLEDDDAAKAKGIMGRYDTVKQLFPKR